MSLDELYGPMRDADGEIGEFEIDCSPISLEELNDETAPLLKTYFEAAAHGLKLPRTVHDTFNLLWVIAEDGKVRFAAEEVVDTVTKQFFALRSRNRRFKNPEGTIRIGHPSLLPKDDKRARIGGEIQFVPEENRWQINNFSGRYGYLRKHLSKHNLEAAASLFARHGIALAVEYRPPPPDKEAA